MHHPNRLQRCLIAGVASVAAAGGISACDSEGRAQPTARHASDEVIPSLGLHAPAGTHLDLGRFESQQIEDDGLTCEWRLVNSAKSSIRVTRLVSSCGCLTVSPAAPFVVAAYEEVVIRATLAAGEAGVTAQTIHVLADGIPPIELSVRAEVLDDLGISFDRPSASREDRQDLLVRLRTSADTGPESFTLRFEGEGEGPGDSPWTGDWIYAGVAGPSLPDAGHLLFYGLVPRDRLPAYSAIATIRSMSYSGRFSVRASQDPIPE